MPNDDDSDEPAAEPARMPVDHEPARAWLSAITELLGMTREEERSEATSAELDRFLRVALCRAIRVLRGDVTDE